MPFALHSIFAGVPSVAVTGVVAGARAAHWGASLALVLGGLLVGAAVARALTRREQERLRAVEEREHGMRIRALEMRRLDAVAALGRAAAELAERSLRDAAKAPRRPHVAPPPLLAPADPLPAAATLLEAPRRSAPALRHPAGPLETAPAADGGEWIVPAWSVSFAPRARAHGPAGGDLERATSPASPDRNAQDRAAPARRSQDWSLPIAPIPRGAAE